MTPRLASVGLGDLQADGTWDGFAGSAPLAGSTGANGRVATGVTPGRTGRRANLLTGRGAHQPAAADTAPSEPVGPGGRTPQGDRRTCGRSAPRAETAGAQAGPHPYPGRRPSEAARVVAGPAEVVPAGIAGRAAGVPATVVARGTRGRHRMQPASPCPELAVAGGPLKVPGPSAWPCRGPGGTGRCPSTKGGTEHQRRTPSSECSAWILLQMFGNLRPLAT